MRLRKQRVIGNRLFNNSDGCADTDSEMSIPVELKVNSAEAFLACADQIRNEIV